ncbi:MAG TPA: hypothetical protein VGR78_13670, partial [Verrucomicrobiae bacterium]|nr:hypothetical protein [Verrucomicrobiae bacterium]
ELPWRLGGARDWELTTNVTHDGVLGMQTALLDLDFPFQDCWLETTVEGPGVLSFWWKASTSDYPFAPPSLSTFQLLLDGVEQYHIYGDVDWEARALSVTSGSHTARWTWSLRANGGNSNLCWLDQVAFKASQTGAPRIKDAVRLPDGEFKLTIDGPNGASYGIEACSNLQTWLPIGQVAAPDGVITFTHQTAGNYSVHFYRLVLLAP